MTKTIGVSGIGGQSLANGMLRLAARSNASTWQPNSRRGNTAIQPLSGIGRHIGFNLVAVARSCLSVPRGRQPFADASADNGITLFGRSCRCPATAFRPSWPRSMTPHLARADQIFRVPSHVDSDSSDRSTYSALCNFVGLIGQRSRRVE